ncbi:hypothetical protein OG562_10875 [Streptomyces sp. NBC_01275]|uniref:hypothetical protein n=1 Tax=Streptomyces sp. NBC_01275 TaxID=2903807 RepID=UPI00225417DB|nr:hypothetical protein [Streptomyces sp. NBC_01275]MCX4761474.1 hypothetical protein [Streptomyces sp. NBC_01275]
MTQQRTDGAPSAEAADAYLEALRERLTADGTRVTATSWRDRPVVIGSRSDRKVRWFGTKTELFVFAAAVPEVDNASLADFTGWALSYAKNLRSGLPGARNAVMVLPALVSGSVQHSARDWAAKDARILGTSLIGRPLTVETSASGVTRVTMYRGGVAWGGMFTRHVLEKAALYFP